MIRPHAHRGFVILFIATLALGSCDLFGGLLRPAGVDSTAPYIRFIEEGENLDLTLYADAPGRSAYVVLSTGYAGAVDKPQAVARSLGLASGPGEVLRPDLGEAATEAIRARGLTALDAAARDSTLRPLFTSTGNPAEDYTLKTQAFYVVSNAAGTQVSLMPATCRYASGSSGSGDPLDAVAFGGGRSRTLSIWVADDCWGAAPTKKHGITQTMVDALALKFFGAAGVPSDSIYAWVTNILGDEWGPHGYSNLISPSGNVTILLADISGDNSDIGGIVGYFNPGDSVLGQSGSNERVMFVIDAVMYANPDGEGRGKGTAGYTGGTWMPTAYWAQTVFSTLAHEFQHMIHFYQKAVKLGGNTRYQPVWIDELCSMQIEDLLADKLGVPGPRGVAPTDYTAGAAGNASGRFRSFVLYNDVSLSAWGGTDIYASYAAAYAFGAYLTRNYGGAEFLRRVVQTSNITPGAVAAAAAAHTGKVETIEGLLRRWGAAVLLSDRTDAPTLYRYNGGGAFSSTVNGVEYRLGSINVWNYVTGGSASSGLLIFSQDNLIKAVGGSLSNILLGLGDPTLTPAWTLTVPGGMYATLVLK